MIPGIFVVGESLISIHKGIDGGETWPTEFMKFKVKYWKIEVSLKILLLSVSPGSPVKSYPRQIMMHENTHSIKM